ncbi:OFA family MFS transporter [Streptomyces sp. NPDC057654]|uniref:OFA family MFS transporter n=1 Tax=Streptomyces sp. NPDC057654 TaxID=3346196 RepID=UPI003686BB35
MSTAERRNDGQQDIGRQEVGQQEVGRQETSRHDAATPAYREITDSKGRVYRVGETDLDILGHKRRLMVILPWVAMMGISVFEYAYGSAESTLHKAHGWTNTNTFWILSVWVFFQAGIAFPAGRLREKGLLSARAAMFLGAALACVGFLSISHLHNVVEAIIGFGVIGGTGAGMVYATCINMVGKWYPERRGGKTGFVNGGFAYGALPFIFIFNYTFDAGDYREVLDLVGLYVLIVVGCCAFFFKDPPKNWWPAHIDPLSPRTTGKTANSLSKNPPAARQYGPMEAIRTGMLPLMWFCLVIIAGVSIFGISFQVPFAKEVGFGPLVAAMSMGVMSVINGTGRGAVGWISDRWGRKPTLVVVLVIEGLAQFGVLWAGDARNQFMFLVFAVISGFGGGAFFPLFAALVPDYFGENHNASNYGLVYSAKLVSGLFGGGLGAMVVSAWGFSGAYVLAGGISLVAAACSMLLRPPGQPRAPRRVKVKTSPLPVHREAI